MIWSSRRKKEGIFCTISFARGKLLWHLCLSQCILHLRHFRNIHTFIYQKTLLHAFFLVVFKIRRKLSVYPQELMFLEYFKLYSAHNVRQNSNLDNSKLPSLWYLTGWNSLSSLTENLWCDNVNKSNMKYWE